MNKNLKKYVNFYWTSHPIKRDIYRKDTVPYFFMLTSLKNKKFVKLKHNKKSRDNKI